MRRHRSLLSCFGALMLLCSVFPFSARAHQASPAIPITWLLQSDFALLPPVPNRVTISRIILAPGAEDSESVPGVRLVLVERGQLLLHANGDVPVIRVATGPGPAPTATATAVPTPGPAPSPTTDATLEPGDGFPVPKQLLHVIRNAGTEPAVILDVRITTDVPPEIPAELEVETLGFDDYLWSVPTGYVAGALGLATLPGGGALAPPEVGDYHFVVAANGRSDLLRHEAGGVVRNGSPAPLDVVVAAILQDPAAGLPRPPLQPATGPGGAEYAYRAVVEQHYGGLPEAEYWLFEPADPAAGGEAAGPFPVVLIVGGCCQELPDYPTWPPEEFEEWIDHLVKRGTIVIFPLMRSEQARDDIAATMRAAMTELGGGGHAEADWTRFAVAGVSFGGVQAPLYAAGATAAGLPVPAAIFSVVPYDPGPSLDLAGIPTTTAVIVLTVEEDNLAGEGGRRVWAALTHIPLDRRDYLHVPSDRHGNPPLVAAHTIASASPRWGWANIDAHDWYGVWKLSSSLFACAWSGELCVYALGDTPEQRFLGVWSDGVPVAELQVTDDPGPPVEETTES